MKPVEFKEQNIVIAKDQPEYIPLPAHIVNETQTRIITVWQMSFFERFRVLFTGRIILSLMTFGKPVQPIHMVTNKWKMLNKEYFEQQAAIEEMAKNPDKVRRRVKKVLNRIQKK